MQIFAMPVFDMIETFLVKQLKFTPSFMLRLVTRSLYVGKLASYDATPTFRYILLPFV